MLRIGRWNHRRRFVEASAPTIIHLNVAVKHWQRGGCQSLRPTPLLWPVRGDDRDGTAIPMISGKHFKAHEVSCCIKYFIFGFNIIFWVRSVRSLSGLLPPLRHTTEAKPRRARSSIVVHCHRLQPEDGWYHLHHHRPPAAEGSRALAARWQPSARLCFCSAPQPLKDAAVIRLVFGSTHLAFRDFSLLPSFDVINMMNFSYFFAGDLLVTL